MGQDGIGATLTGSLEPGEIVTLEIPLPLTPYPIKVRAIVRYRQGLRYGFEFLTLNDGQRDTILRVCDTWPPKPRSYKVSVNITEDMIVKGCHTLVASFATGWVF